MLVAALAIEVGPPAELRPALDHRLPADARVEPDVEDVGLEAKARRLAARTREPRRHELRRRTGEPGVRALALEDVGDVVTECLARDRLAALFTVDGDHRHAPVALARDAPVGPGRDHVADPLPSPGGDPAHALDLGERALAEVAALHADEPLLGRAEDDRVLAPPAVRVAVRHRLRGEQRATGAQVIDDWRVGLEHAHALPLRHLD